MDCWLSYSGPRLFVTVVSHNRAQYEFDDLERDFLGVTYSKGAEFFAYFSITGCYTRFSTSPVEGLIVTQRARSGLE
jgi:hypothetical protein